MARRKKNHQTTVEQEISKDINELNIGESIADFVTSEIVQNISFYEPTIVSTDVKTLDTVLGGGIYTGYTAQITSPPETGKSTISLQIAARLLETHPQSFVLYIDVENPPVMLKGANPVVERLQTFLSKSDSSILRRFIYLPGEKLFSRIFESLNQIFERKSEIEKKLNIKNPIPAIVIWDSIAETIPDELVKGALEEGEITKQKGLKAKTTQDYLSVITYLSEKSNVGLILLDQIRSVIDIQNRRGAQSVKDTSSHKNVKSATNSLAQHHKVRQWIFMEKGKEINYDYPGVNGWILKITMDKNKIVPSTGMTIEVVFDKMRGLDSFWSHYHFLSNRMPYETKILNNASVPSQIRKTYEEGAPLAISGAKISYPGIGEKSFRSKVDMYKAYYSDEEFKELFDKILEKSIEDRINSFINPKSEFQEKIRKIAGVVSEEEK